MHCSLQPMLSMLDAREMKMLDAREMEGTSSSMSSKSSMWGEEEVLGFTIFFPHSFFLPIFTWFSRCLFLASLPILFTSILPQFYFICAFIYPLNFAHYFLPQFVEVLVSEEEVVGFPLLPILFTQFYHIFLGAFFSLFFT